MNYKQHGLTKEQYQQMFADQGGVCAICRRNKKLHIDHDHLIGGVRGLLCLPCNVALGYFRDKPGVLRRAADYLCEEPRFIPTNGIGARDRAKALRRPLLASEARKLAKFGFGQRISVPPKRKDGF